MSRQFKTPRYAMRTTHRPHTEEHRANLSAALRATGRRARAARRCDFCSLVTGDVRLFQLRTGVSTPDARSRTRTVGQGSVLACQECWETFGSRCDMCGEGWRKARPLRHFNLQTHTWVAVGKGVNRAAGHLWLCLSCWRKTAGRRTKAQPVFAGQLKAVA